MRAEALAAAAALTLAACVRLHPPVTAAPAVLGGSERVLGAATGASRATYILGFGPVGDASVPAAVAQALEHRGDALVNMTIDRRTVTIPAPFLPIVTRVETHVSGTAVTYAKPETSAGAVGVSTAAAAPPAFETPPVRGPRRTNWVQEGVNDSDFSRFFENLRRGAAVDLVLIDGERITGNFGRMAGNGKTVRVGKGMLGSREVPIERIVEVRSRTVRGEIVHLKRGSS